MRESWTEEELRATVSAYLAMRTMEQNGIPFVKKRYYTELANQFDRTEKAFEYRMQNISFVFSMLGRQWLKGVAPARNVGARVGAKIESIIAELEGRRIIPRVGHEIETRKARPTAKPAGQARPEPTTGAVSVFPRDPKVRAWVLARASGICECCCQPAPFEDVNGAPFLEVHHLRQLADGGSDRVSNTVAVCPNCHRQLHFGKDAERLICDLYDRIGELEPETAVAT